MKTYFLLFAVATCSSLVLTPIVRRLCERFHWLDEPKDSRRLHSRAIPRLGGIAVFLALLLGLAPLLLIHNLFTDSVRATAPRLLVILVPACLTLILGAFDDLLGLKASYKFAGLAVIGVIFYALGGRIEHLSFLGSVELPWVVGLVLTVAWVVAIANAFNLLDGMDGLASGAAVFSSLVIMAISLTQERPLVVALALVFCGSLVGFLRYNFNPASIFLGDSGALLVGFMLAALSVEGTQKASTAVAVAIPIFAFGLPMVDTGFTIVRRFISGQPLFLGDREHIHHKLLDRGWSQRRTALVLYGVCACFGLLTLLFVRNSGQTTALVLFVVGVAIVLAVAHLRYHEVEELKAGVKRNVNDRRLRGANNIRIRRATRNLSQTRTLTELYDAVAEVLEMGEFAHAVMIVGRAGDAEWNADLLKRELKREQLAAAPSQPPVRAQMREGMIYWHWVGEGPQPADLPLGPLGDGRDGLCSIRLPLASTNGVVGHLNLYRETGSENWLLDINYLCTLFHEEATKAVERILQQPAVPKEKLAARA